MTLAKLLVAIGATTSAYHRGMAKVRADLDATERRFGRFRGGLGRAGGALRDFGKHALFVGTIALAALTAGLGASVGAAIAWEDAFAGVQKTVDATDAEFDVLERGLRDLSTEIPIAATELAGLAETAGALGIAKNDILEFTRVAALIGVTTNVSAQDAATALGQLSNVLGLTGADYERFASTLVDLGNKGASTEADILAIASRSGAAAKLIGLGTAETLGWASAVANLGIEAEAGGSSLQTFFLRTTKIAAKGGDQLAAMARIAGTSSKDFKKLFGSDANAALTKFLRGLGKLDKQQRVIALDELGLDDIRLTRTILGLADSIDRNLVPSLDTANAAWAENGALTEEAEKRFKTTKSQLQLLKNNLFDVGITLGSIFLPLVNRLVGGLVEWIQANEPLITQIGTWLADAIEKIVGAVGRWISENRPLLRSIGDLAKDTLPLLIGATVALWTALTTQVIPALIAVGKWIFENVVPRFREFITTITEPGGVADSVMKVVRPIVDNLLPALGNIASAIFGGNGHRGVLPALGDLVAILWGDGTGPLALALKGIGWLVENVLGPMFTKVLDFFADAFEGARMLIAKIRELLGLGDTGVTHFEQPKQVGQLHRAASGTGIGHEAGRALGGPVIAGVPYLVGEERPEVFIPDQSGRIEPDASGWAAGGGGDTYNVNIYNPTGEPAEEDIGFALRRASFLGQGRAHRAMAGA